MTLSLEVTEIQTAASPIALIGEAISEIGTYPPMPHPPEPAFEKKELSVGGLEVPELLNRDHFAAPIAETWATTALGSWEEIGRHLRTQPKLEVLESAERLLTERTTEALNLLLNLVRSESERLFIPVLHTEVKGHLDPEEGDAQVVITQYVNMSSRAALEYWDMISIIISFWTESLPINLAFVVDDRLDLEVRWIEPTIRST